MPSLDYGSLMNQLRRLFDMWMEAHREEDDWINTTHPGIEKDSFVEDGIVSSAYDGKVLFILKEANILTYRNEEEPSQRSQINWYNGYAQNDPQVKDNRPRQLEKLGRMYCSLVDDNYIPSDIEIRDAVGKIAFMNLNKRGGASSADDRLWKYTKKYYSLGYIPKQIEIINPKHIVCLGTGISNFLQTVDPYLTSRYKIISMYHTAVWGSTVHYMKRFEERVPRNNLV